MGSRISRISFPRRLTRNYGCDDWNDVSVLADKAVTSSPSTKMPLKHTPFRLWLFLTKISSVTNPHVHAGIANDDIAAIWCSSKLVHGRRSGGNGCASCQASGTFAYCGSSFLSWRPCGNRVQPCTWKDVDPQACLGQLGIVTRDALRSIGKGVI
jgi:hypothetical protein